MTPERHGPGRWAASPIRRRVRSTSTPRRPSRHASHEVLHASASPDFLLAVGVAVNEGVTEQLALDALATSRVRAEDGPAYAHERELAAAVVQVTGRDRLLRAYFNGGTDLAELVATVGADTLVDVRNAASSGNVNGALTLLRRRSV